MCLAFDNLNFIKKFQSLSTRKKGKFKLQNSWSNDMHSRDSTVQDFGKNICDYCTFYATPENHGTKKVNYQTC